MNKPRTRKELLEAYGVTHPTFAKWTAKLGLRYLRVFNPLQLKSIYELLGNPYI